MAIASLTADAGSRNAGLRRHRRATRRGAAAVEFAIVGSVIFLVILAFFDFARVAMAYNLLSNATRNGARTAVLQGATNAMVTQAVTSKLQDSVLLNNTTITVTPSDPSTVAYNNRVTVTTAVSLAKISWTGSLILPGTINLSATASMRAEKPQ